MCHYWWQLMIYFDNIFEAFSKIIIKIPRYIIIIEVESYNRLSPCKIWLTKDLVYLSKIHGEYFQILYFLFMQNMKSTLCCTILLKIKAYWTMLLSMSQGFKSLNLSQWEAEIDQRIIILHFNIFFSLHFYVKINLWYLFIYWHACKIIFSFVIIPP